MHPVLFHLPQFPAWVGGALLLALAGLFAWYARRDPTDKGSWWFAGACVVGAIALVATQGFSGVIAPWPIRFFGIFFVLGFLAAVKAFSMRNARLGLLGADESFDFGLFVLLAGIGGARAFHVLQNTEQFQGRPEKMLAITDGGLVWYGGLLASTLYAWYWLAKKGKDLWSVSDSLALGVPLGHAVGRIGCFLAGCDYGKVVPGGRAELPWAVHFPFRSTNPLAAVPEGTVVDPLTLVPPSMSVDPETGAAVWLHPVQIYLALFNVLTFALLWAVDRKSGKGAFPGRLAAIYMMSYAVGRAVLERWRGDEDRGLYFGGAVSFSQIVSAVVFVAGLLLYRSLRRRAKPASAA